MDIMPACPECKSDLTYHDGSLFVCPECAHEWSGDENISNSDERVVKDANGNILQDGDSIILIKDLKLKGSSTTLKKGAKAKSIRLDGDHEIDCKIDDMKIMLKAEYVKKV